jgi:hypothetical protein
MCKVRLSCLARRKVLRKLWDTTHYGRCAANTRTHSTTGSTPYTATSAAIRTANARLSTATSAATSTGTSASALQARRAKEAMGCGVTRHTYCRIWAFLFGDVVKGHRPYRTRNYRIIIDRISRRSDYLDNQLRLGIFRR